MRSSNCTAFISASGICLLASDPGCKLTVARAVPARTALEFPRDFRGAERPNRQGDRKFESGFLQRGVSCEPDFRGFRKDSRTNCREVHRRGRWSVAGIARHRFLLLLLAFMGHDSA